MSFQFFRRKQKANFPENTISFRIHKGLLYVWSKAKKHFADYLSKRTICIPTERLKRYLLLFCIVGCSASIAIVLYPFISYRNSSIAAPQKISFPVHLDNAAIKKERKDSSIPFQKYQRIMEFSRKLDSLRYSDKGRKTYDSVMKIYPGLQDSILLLKDLYYSQ